MVPRYESFIQPFDVWVGKAFYLQIRRALSSRYNGDENKGFLRGVPSYSHGISGVKTWRKYAVVDKRAAVTGRLRAAAALLH